MLVPMLTLWASSQPSLIQLLISYPEVDPSIALQCSAYWPGSVFASKARHDDDA